MLFCVIGWLAAPTPTDAHSWYSGLHNEAGEYCCGGSDCGPVSDADVTPVPGGYQVHTWFDPMASGKATWIQGFVPNVRAAPAKEGGEYHLCVVGGSIRCFFVPAPAY